MNAAVNADQAFVFGDLTDFKTIVSASFDSMSAKSVSRSLPCREAAEANVRALSVSAETNCSMLLGTALVLLDDVHGLPRLLRGIIDTGSQINLITRSAAAMLKLTPSACTTTLQGLGSIRAVALGKIDTTLRSRLDSTFTPAISATITDVIVGSLPNQAIDKSIKQGFNTNELADPSFDTPGKIDVLLGVEIVGKILDYDGLHLSTEPAYALGTRLGKVILGAVPARPSKKTTPSTSCLSTSDPLMEVLTKFWEAEEPTKQTFSKPEDDLCEQIYRQTTTRTPEGRYVVALPFVNDSFSLQTNRNTTFSKFRSFERRTCRDEDLRTKFVDFMGEYRKLGHMVPASRKADYVIPYHCVLRPSSTTTKLRTVFNASAPDIQGHTLNEQLLSGPKLQLDLPHILVNLRLFNIVVCADVRMMFRQILVRKQDRIFQHIFYRDAPTEPVQEFELTTVTYGMNCSPFLAQRTLLQLVEDEGETFPLAADALRNCTYVDDIVAGAESTEEAYDLMRQLNGLLAKGGFELRKWSSNKRDIVDSLEECMLENPLLFSDDSTSVKILGMKWMPSQDHFEYQIQPYSSSITKRNILSYVACMYDPLGLLTPVTFWIKHFIQMLWLAKADWDEELPPSLSSEWNKFADGLLALGELSIPRQIGSRSAKLRLLGFADASGKGYAACVYLHSTYQDGTISVHLLRAKSKVAPLTTSTIPRLELCGAWLLARLLATCLESLRGHNVLETRLHSDAKVILSWISTPPHKLKMFVANRVAKILEHSKPGDWFHVKTEDNPADVASRGCLPEDLIRHSLWWRGPDYYQTRREDWPERAPEEEVVDLPELKTDESATLVINTTNPVELPSFLTKFSSYRTSVRVTAYVLRFLNHCRGQRPPKTEVLSAGELQKASDFCALQVQRAYFAEERQELEKGKIPKKWKSLTPHIDPSSLVRVGGRLVNAHVSAGARHPILLPKKSHFTDLVCDYHHSLSCHAGPRATQASILQKFWILSMRTTIRQRYHRCFKCYRLKAKPLQPAMGALPLSRVGQCRPFSKVGLDFAGPFNTKLSTARKAGTTKSYLCVFVCMVVKAVHLEFVSELSTKAFLNAYDRFVARRGLPTDVYSDNGTNFVGADRHLCDTLAHLRADDKDIFGHLAAKGTNWHFNPPAAPNFGGLWEAAVKSAKTLLRRSLGDVSQTFEEYTTFFCKVEAVLNSRPLLDFSTEPTDAFSMLTPGHFLIGTALTSPPEPQLAENATYPCKWKRIRQQLQGFWRQWSKEYLHTLLQQHKWTTAGQTVEVGQIVFLYGTTTNPLEWPLARVISLQPGADGVTRVVTVKTANSTLTRPLNKLVPLPSA